MTIFFDFKDGGETRETFFLDIDESWADTFVNQMSLEEKIGQLFLGSDRARK